jgi:multidrug efflux system membrane fusion protein
MRRGILTLALGLAAAFAAGAVSGLDWRNVVGNPAGDALNEGGATLRSALGMNATPERVVVAPGAVAAPVTAAAPPAKGPPASGGPPGGSAGGPPQVTVSKPVVREIVEWDEYTARLDAVEQVDVRARVGGYLNEVRFKDGDNVQQGDLLFVIDPRPFERVLDQARAELEAANTKANNARLDVDRGGPLVDRKVMSQKVFDDRESALRDALATIRVAEAKVKTAELDLSFTRVVSPLTGRISRSLVTPGNYISGGTSNVSTLLTTIVRQDPIYVYFDVSENNYLKYKRLQEQGQKGGASALGAAVGVALSDEPGFKHTARLDFIDNRLDQATATIRVRALLENPKGLFTPGLFARVRLAGTPPYQGILLPDEAILSDQASKFVYTVGEDGTAIRKSVVLGPLVDKLRVVRSGVTADDWVVTKGLQRARPGLKLNPRREPIKVSDAAPSHSPTTAPR